MIINTTHLSYTFCASRLFSALSTAEETLLQVTLFLRFTHTRVSTRARVVTADVPDYPGLDAEMSYYSGLDAEGPSYSELDEMPSTRSPLDKLPFVWRVKSGIDCTAGLESRLRIGKIKQTFIFILPVYRN